MEVSGQLHDPAALPSEEPQVLTEDEIWRVPEPVWTLWSREKSFAPAGNRTPTVQSLAHHYTDWAILDISQVIIEEKMYY
jgi:hypothetical protein